MKPKTKKTKPLPKPRKLGKIDRRTRKKFHEWNEAIQEQP